MTPFRIAFEIPPDTSLNSRAHFRAKAGLIRDARRIGRLTGEQIVRDHPGETFPVEAYSLVYEFEFRDRRSRDLDNFIGRMKPILDGLIESGLLGDDRNVERLTATKRVRTGTGAKRGRCIVEIHPQRAGDRKPGS